MDVQLRRKPVYLPRRASHFIGAYAAGMLAAVLAGAFSGIVVGLDVWLVVTGGIWLWQKGVTYSRQQLWGKIFLFLFIPAILWFLFGIGGLIVIFFPDAVTYHGVLIEELTVMLFTIYVLLGCLAYLLVVKVLVGRRAESHVHGTSPRNYRLVALALGLLLFDWYVRIHQIRVGVYFTWLQRYAELANEARTTNPLYHLQNNLASLVLPLLVYLDSRTKHKLFRLLIAVQLVLVFLRGTRQELVLALFSFVAAVYIVNRRGLNAKLYLVVSVFVLFFFGLLSPAIQVARVEMRLDARQLQEDPARVPNLFVTEYLPRAFASSPFSNSDDRASTLGRLGSYMGYAASIHQRLLDGDARLNINGLWVATSLAIPRLLYPNKPTVDADEIVRQQFGLSGFSDAAGTPIADVFSYLHVAGILLLLVAMAIVAGLIGRLFLRYGTFGELLLLGLFINLLTVGDAFGAYLATLRNVTLVAIALRFWFPVSDARAQDDGRSTHSPRSDLHA